MTTSSSSPLSFDFSSARKVDLKFSELFSREIFQFQDLEIKKFIYKYCITHKQRDQLINKNFE